MNLELRERCRAVSRKLRLDPDAVPPAPPAPVAVSPAGIGSSGVWSGRGPLATTFAASQASCSLRMKGRR